MSGSLSLLALVASTWSTPLAAVQQTGDRTGLQAIVSRAVTYGTGEAGLSVETDQGARLEIEFRDGVLTIGDEQAGSYTPGGALEDSWRLLLAQAVQLDDGALAQALVDWSPPADAGEVGSRVDRLLEETLQTPEGVAAETAPVGNAPADQTVASILERVGELGSLAQLLAGADVDEMRIVIGEDFEVPAGTDVDQSVLVIDGDVDIRGRIRGDLFVADGDVELRDGARIDGDLRMAGGFLDRDGGEVSGEVVDFEPGSFVLEADLRDRIRAELRNEMSARERSRAPSRLGFFHRLGRAMGALFDTVLTAFVTGLLGVLALHFGGDRFDRIAETARRSPGRAAMVGGAAAFLAFPVWIIGAVALVVTIIGIPAAVVWLPAFPLAVGLSLVVGYTAVARNIGAWLSRQDYPGFDWVLVTRPNTLVFGGVFFLMLPFAIGHVLELGGGLLDTLQALVTVGAVLAGVFVTLAGFGAVLMTRGGRRTDFEADDFFSDPGGGWGFEPPFGWGKKSDVEAFEEELAKSAETEATTDDTADVNEVSTDPDGKKPKGNTNDTGSSDEEDS